MSTATAILAPVKSAAKPAKPTKRDRNRAAASLVVGGTITVDNPSNPGEYIRLDTLGQTRKPPTMRALRRAMDKAPFLICAF